MWLAATEGTEGDMERLPHWPETIEVNETVWRDFYTGEKLEEHYAKLWYTPLDFGTGDDTLHGENHNCLAMYTHLPKQEEALWFETRCYRTPGLSCPCQYQQQPVLRLRGLCHRKLDNLFTLVQSDPRKILLMGQATTKIEYNDLTKEQ